MAQIRLPIGYSNFKEVIDNKFNFVDKSLLIKEIIDDAKVVLITRPRLFGKTLNMSMLQYFFAAEVYGQSTKGLFNNLKIMQTSDDYLQHLGKYPVIFISLKDIIETSFASAYGSFCKIIKDLYSEHRYLLSSSKLCDEDKATYESILKRQATPVNIKASLKDLTRYLYIHHDRKPIILIDEYDTPLRSSYLCDYYAEMIGFLGNFLSAALKDNPYLFKAVLTGILRVSKESLFSDLNNIAVYSLLRFEYSQYFGFTETEVSDLLEKANLQNTADAIKHWYNGYQFNSQTVYNPWSIINCIKERGILKPYWVNTSSDELVKSLLLKSKVAFKERFESLLRGESAEQIIDENLVYPGLQKNHESAVWSLLLMTGYLTVSSHQQTHQGALCQLTIPNQEIRNMYRAIIEQWVVSC